MRYATNSRAEKIEVSYSGEKAVCPGCKTQVIGKKGKINIPHWAHIKHADCDTWYEPISQWHLDWQNLFPAANQEVIIVDSSSGRHHRADVMLNNGLVIEIQNSPIEINQIAMREGLYGRKNMIWILNGNTLAAKSEIITKFFTPRQYIQVKFNIPGPVRSARKNVQEFLDSQIFDDLSKDENILRTRRLDVYTIIIEFLTQFRIEDTELLLRKNLRCFVDQLNENREEEMKVTFTTELKTNSLKQFPESISLEKKHWRKFIDHMEFPVFFDNLAGLAPNELYWYQAEKKVLKEEFLEKYLANN